MSIMSRQNCFCRESPAIRGRVRDLVSLAVSTWTHQKTNEKVPSHQRSARPGLFSIETSDRALLGFFLDPIPDLSQKS